MRVGVEVGGTFTDLVAVEGGKIVVTKVPSTPRSPDVGAFDALKAEDSPRSVAARRGMKVSTLQARRGAEGADASADA